MLQGGGIGVGTQVPPMLPEVEKYMRKMQFQTQRDFQFWNTQPVPKISKYTVCTLEVLVYLRWM